MVDYDKYDCSSVLHCTPTLECIGCVLSYISGLSSVASSCKCSRVESCLCEYSCTADTYCALPSLPFSSPIHVNSLTGRMQAVVGLAHSLPSSSLLLSSLPPSLPAPHASIYRSWSVAPSIVVRRRQERVEARTGHETTLFAHGEFEFHLKGTQVTKWLEQLQRTKFTRLYNAWLNEFYNSPYKLSHGYLGFKDTVVPLPIAIVLVMALLVALTDIECTSLHLTTSPTLSALSGRPPTCNTTAACATLS